ncbi:MAG: PASTA domain-containing protein [Ruminococcaceae bacterium]|nr:PASTA domain-containing protein [Oscillospiraceae bacterium]
MARTTRKLKSRGLIAVAILLILGFGTDICRLFYIQVVKGEEYKTKAEAQQLSDTEISADRGIIYDCNYNVLAESASAWLVYVNPSKIKDDSQRKLISTTLANILELDEARIYEKISNSDYSYVKIQGKVEYTEKTLISDFIDDSDLYDIVNIDPDTKRYYPYSNFASTIIGFTGSEDSGRAGLELMYNDSLSGVAGRVITAKNARNDAMSSNFETTYDAKQGTSLVLTLDKTIQHYLEKGLSQAVIDNDAASAYGIVMEVETGAILAMATLPDYDLNLPTVITDEEVLKELSKIKDEEKYDLAYNEKIYSMWRNKSVSDTYEPGSVFKIFVAAAALEEGLVTPDFCFNCSGSIKVADNVLHCHKDGGHGNQTLAEGLMNSCNPFFVTIGQKLGTKSFYKYFDAFGFTQETEVDLPGEATPVKDVTYHSLENMGISQVSSSSFGQTFQVSAIQMITGVSAVANGGSLMQPYIVQAMLDEDGNTVFEAEPTVKRSVISETTSESVLAMMEKVVSEGTGRNAYVPGYRVAGKTGTSEKLTVDGEYIASFVGCAPADDPKIAVLIVIDEPQGAVHGGGAIAAPVAGTVIEETLKYMNIDPVYSAKELAQLNGVTPDVNSMSVDKAKATLKNKGFSARVVGDGKTVVSQYPLKGQNIPLDGVVILYTEKEASNTTATVPDLTGLSISSANERAVNAGFNIKISGASLDSEVVSYRQSIDSGTQAELGATITVYFKTNKGVED